MIIDCHCHAGKGDGLTGPWDTDANLTRYLKRADECGITNTVLFSAFHSDYRKANRHVASIVMSDMRFMGFAFVNCQKNAGEIHDMVRIAVDEYQFCGIKVHQHDGKLSRECLEAASTYRLPILYDPMGEINVVEMAASEYKNVNMIIPHLGSFADDWQKQLAFIDVLERYVNVYTDFSGVRRFGLIEEAYRRAGADKILFGTDGPWLHPGIELAKIKALSLPKSETDKILSGNFLKLISNIKNRNHV